MATKIAIVKKLSGKVLVGQVKAYAKDLQEGQSVDLFNVIGVASGLKHGTTNFGDFTALMGQFIAEPLVGAKAGQRFRTGQLFLPDVALNMVAPIVENLGKGESVELAFRIGITASETSSVGYEYNAEFLVQPKENDPLEALMAKALPAPAKEPEAPAKGKETAKA
jgi:hypothetical protein